MNIFFTVSGHWCYRSFKRDEGNTSFRFNVVEAARKVMQYWHMILPDLSLSLDRILAYCSTCKHLKDLKSFILEDFE